MTETALKSGAAIGHYVIVSVASKDRSGITYLATDTTSVSGAVKVRIREVFPDALVHRENDMVFAGDSESAASGFTMAIHAARHLAQTVSRLEHPSIPRVRDAFEFNGTHYTVFDEPDGETYASLLVRNGPLPAAQIKSLLIILLPALEALHAAGLVHGRLSSTTIVRLDDGYPAITGIESAAFNSDTSADLRGLGETCDMLWTAGSGSTASGNNVAQEDLRLARAIQGAAGQAGAPQIKDIAAFRKLALKSAPVFTVNLPSKKVLIVGASAGAIALAAAASILPNTSREPETLVLSRVEVVLGAAEDPFAVKAQDVSLRELVKTPAGLPGTTPSSAWASIDRNQPVSLRAFVEAFPKSDQADLASERLELLDERLWLAAEKAGTSEAINAYLEAFNTKKGAKGAHVEEALRLSKRFTKSHKSVLTDSRRLLGELGYDVGKGGGETPALARAIRRFEADEGLKTTGEASAKLVTAWEKAAFRAASVSFAKPAPSAPVNITTAPTTVATSLPAATVDAASPTVITPAEPVIAPVSLPPPPPPRKIVRTPASMPTKLKPITFPTRARDLGEEGTSVVKACVRADGSLASTRIFESSGSKRLDLAALDWVGEHKGFKPATADGEPVEGGCFQVPVLWEIKD